MKNYKKPNGSIWAFEPDGSQDHLITADMVPISDAELAMLREPVIADLKSAAITQVRAIRVNVFATLAGIQSQALANADTAMAKAISGLQDQLKALPDLDLSKCKTQADIDAAFAAGWAAIVAAAPANVASAFNGISA